MSPIFTVFAALFVAVFATVLGRLLATHSGERYYHTTPLHCFIAGLGIWYLWFLVFVKIAGFSLVASTVSFTVISMVLFFILPKFYQIKLEMEHFWSLMVAALIILLPTFIIVGNDLPSYWREFTTYIKFADYLFWLDGMPLQKDIDLYAIGSLKKPLALSVAVSPISLITQYFNPAIFACWSFFLVAVTAGGLTKSAGISVRWSNLPLVAAGSLIAITVLNPFLQIEALFSAYIELWVAATLFCAMMPLFSKKPLPHGWEVIPTVFVLVFLVGLIPSGIYLVGIVVLLWIIRMIVEERCFSVANTFSLIVLILIPSITFLLWHGNGSAMVYIDNSLPRVISSQSSYYIILAAGGCIGIISIWHFMRILFCDFCLKRSLFIENAWYVLPAIVFIIGVIMAFYFGANWGIKYILYTQFILLLPVWIYATKIYKNMWIRNLAFKAPWGIGLFLILIIVGLEFSYQKTLKQKYTLNHVQQVGSHLANKKDMFGSKIAVLDKYNSLFYADVLGFYLNHINNVTAIKETTKLDKNSLHKTLKANNIKYLWVHRTSNEIEQIIGAKLKPAKSYLFSVKNFSFELIGVYPHPNYK